MPRARNRGRGNLPGELGPAAASRSPRRGLAKLALTFWLAVGLMVAFLALWSQLRDVDDLAFTLRVGTDSGTRDFIESELGEVPLTEGLGHDGQYSYLIARDPLGLEGLPELADDGAYRYRRALHGWLAGGFGLVGPEGVLLGLSVWAMAGFALATAAAADVATLLGARLWTVVGVVGNLGMWLSVQLATSDALAMGLALLGVALVLRRRRGWALVALAGAALAKDAYLLFAVGLAGWMFVGGERRSAHKLLLVPALPLAAWIAWASWQIGDGLSGKGNFALLGLAGSFGEWDTTGDLVQGLVALVAVLAAVGFVAATRDRLLAWLVFPWVAVALISSSVVWGDGNNAVRAFAPLWLLAVLGAALYVGRRRLRAATAD